MNSAVGEPSGHEADPAPRRPPLRAWLQLVRLPNLFTVPGDPLAGACLAGALASVPALPQLLVAALSAVLSIWARAIEEEVPAAARPHTTVRCNVDSYADDGET